MQFHIRTTFMAGASIVLAGCGGAGGPLDPVGQASEGLTGPMSTVKSATGATSKDTALATTKDNGGHILIHPEVMLTFWGAGWGTTSPVAPSVGQVTGALQDMLNGPYFALLNQYRSIARPRMIPAVAIDTTNPPATIQESDIVNHFISQFASGALPAPNNNYDVVYTVMLPNGFHDAAGDWGAHDVATYNGTNFYYAWVTGDGTMTGDTSHPDNFAHELAEATTDPVPGTGITPEISDPCNSQNTIINQYSVQGYWSAADGKCVIPTAWGSVSQYNGTPGSWTVIGGNVRTIESGPWGLVATNTSNNLLKYSGTPNSWTQIGGPGSMFAVTGESVYGVTPDGSAIYRYNGSGTSWSKVGGPGIIAAYGGGYGLISSIQTNAAMFLYNQPANSWSLIGGVANQYAVNADGVYAISYDHSQVQRYEGSWSTIGTSAEWLYVGDKYVAALNPGTLDIFGWTGSAWESQGSPGEEFAVTGHGAGTDALFGLAPAKSQVNESKNINAANPGWTNVGGYATRLVGGGSTLYETTGLVYLTQ